MAGDTSQPHSRALLPPLSRPFSSRNDLSRPQLLMSSVPCRLPPASTFSPASASEAPGEHSSWTPTSHVCSPSLPVTSPGTDMVCVSSPLHWSSFSPGSQTPHLVHSSVSPQRIAVASSFSTSASSCDVELDSPFSLPPTPPPSPASDYSQSIPSLGDPVLHLLRSINAECFSSTTASIPSSAYSSCTSVAGGTFIQQLDNADVNAKQLFQGEEVCVSAVSPTEPQQCCSASSPVTLLLLPALSPISTTRKLEPTTCYSTLNCNSISPSIPACVTPVTAPAVSGQRLFQHPSSALSHQRRHTRTVITTPCNSPTAGEPAVPRVCGTFDFDYINGTYLAGLSSHLLPIETDRSGEFGVKFPAATVTYADCGRARRTEVARAPLLLCMLTLAFVASGVAILVGVSGGCWGVLSLSSHRLRGESSILTHSKDATYASVPSDLNPQLPTVLPAAGTTAEASSSTKTPEIVSEKVVEQGEGQVLKHHVEGASRRIYSSSVADKESETDEEQINAELGPSIMAHPEESQRFRIRGEPDSLDVSPGSAHERFSRATAAGDRGSSVFAAISDFLAMSWRRLGQNFVSEPTVSTPAEAKDFLTTLAVKTTRTTSSPSHFDIPARTPLEGLFGATMDTFLSKAITLSGHWRKAVCESAFLSLKIMPGGFLVSVALSVCCCFCCLLLSGTLVYKHLTNYYEPHLQRYICRVCLIAPAFAISSLAYFAHTLPRITSGIPVPDTGAHTFTGIPDDTAPSRYSLPYAARGPGLLTLASHGAAHAGSEVPWNILTSASLARQEEVFVEFLRDLAQAVAVYSFLVLMTNCCGGDRCISLTVACNPNKVSPVPPLNFFCRPFHPGPHILRYLRIGVMQCVLVVPLVGVLSLLQALSSDTYVGNQESSWLPAGPARISYEAAGAAVPSDDLLRQTDAFTEKYFPSRLDESLFQHAGNIINESDAEPKAAHVTESFFEEKTDHRTAAQQRTLDRSGDKFRFILQAGSRSGTPWRSLLLLCSVTICMLSLLQFYICTEYLLRPYKPLQKFISIKFLVFFQVWQKLAIHFMLRLSILQVNDVLTPEDTADLYHNVMMGVWTLTVSISHLLCFPLKDHLPEVPPGSDTISQPGASLLHSLLDVFLAVDVLQDAREMTLVQHPSLDRACSLLLDQSVEANRAGFLAPCTTTPQCMYQMETSFPEALHRAEEMTKTTLLRVGKDGDNQGILHPTLVRAAYAAGEVAACKDEAARFLPPHSCPRQKDHNPCARLQIIQPLSPGERQPQVADLQIKVDAVNARRKTQSVNQYRGECDSFPAKTMSREQGHTVTHPDATAELLLDPTEPVVLSDKSVCPENPHDIVVNNQPDDSRQPVPVRVVISSTESEVCGHLHDSVRQLGPLYSNVAGYTPQQRHLNPTQANSHALVASLGTPPLLLPHSSLLADTPLHLRHVTPSSDSYTVRSTSLQLWRVGDTTTAYPLSGSPLTERGHQYLSDTTAAAAAAAVAAATSRTPLSATAKAAAAARFVFTAGANSPFRDCPAAALAAALGDFDPARNYTSIATAVSARDDSDELNEGEEGGMPQQIDRGRSSHFTQSSIFLSHPACAYTSSSSSTSFLTDNTRRDGSSENSNDEGEAGNISFKTGGDTHKNRRNSAPDGGHLSARRVRSWSGSLCGYESHMHRTNSDETVARPKRRRSLAWNFLPPRDSEKTQGVGDVLYNNPVATTTDMHQKSRICSYGGTQQQQGAERRVMSSLFNWARQSWGLRSAPTLSNAREAFAWFTSNFRTVTSTSTTSPYRFHGYHGCDRQASAPLRGSGSAVHTGRADSVFGWRLEEEEESQEKLMQALTQQQQLWASPVHRTAIAECSDKQIPEERDKEIKEREVTSSKTSELDTRQLFSESNPPTNEASRADFVRRVECPALTIEAQGQNVVVRPSIQLKACREDRQKQRKQCPLQRQEVTSDLCRNQTEREGASSAWRQTNNFVNVPFVDNLNEPDAGLGQKGPLSSPKTNQLKNLRGSQLQQTTGFAYQHQRKLSGYVEELSAGDLEQGDQHVAHRSAEGDEVHLSSHTVVATEHNSEKRFCSATQPSRDHGKHLPEQQRGKEGERKRVFRHESGNTKKSHGQTPAFVTNDLTTPTVEGRAARAKSNRKAGKAKRSRRNSNHRGKRDSVERLSPTVSEQRAHRRCEKELHTERHRSQQFSSVNTTGILRNAREDGRSPEKLPDRNEHRLTKDDDVKEEGEQTPQLSEDIVTDIATSKSHRATTFYSGCITCTAAEGEISSIHPQSSTSDSLRIRRIGWSISAEEEEDGEAL